MERLSQNKSHERFLKTLYLLWFLAFVVGWLNKDVLHLPEVNWYPLLLRDARFSDFTIFQERFKQFHQAEFFQLAGLPFTYPAPVAVLFAVFYSFGRHALGVFLTFSFVVFIGAGVALGRAMNRRGLDIADLAVFVGSSILLSYPFWFLVDRANIEIVNWLFLALGVSAYWNRRWYLAAALFGLATSFKIFPFVFFGLLLSVRRFKAIGWGLLICACSTFLSTWIVGPTYRIASVGIANGLEFFKTQYILQIHREEIGFDHSAFAIIKKLVFAPSVVQGQLRSSLLYVYLTIVGAAGVCLYFWRIRTLPRANQILALTVASILFPPVSGDYTLIHLYIPFAALVLISMSWQEMANVRGLTVSFICMAFLMAPESFVIVNGVKVGGQLKAVALFILFIVSIICPFEEPDSVDHEKQFVVTEATVSGIRNSEA